VLQEAAQLREELSRHEVLERQLTRDIAVIDERVAELGRRRNVCSAREFRAKAFGSSEEFLPPDVEDVFDRWEIKLTTVEPLVGGEADSLDARFAVDEERASLESELNELLRAAHPSTQEAR
jgi:phage shock protein A